MKNNKLLKFEIISTIFILLAGTLLHFTYEWSHNNILVGIFSAVNESVWEHIKILFIPTVITILVGSYYFKNIPNYLCSKTKGLLISMSFIVIFYYTYSGIIGTHYPVVDILSFIVAIIIGLIYTIRQINNENKCNNKQSIITLVALLCLFIIFTFNPPHLNIFKDPKTNNYGIKL